MTVLVGVKYPNGLIMASDLVSFLEIGLYPGIVKSTLLIHIREEGKKLFSGENIIIGVAGYTPLQDSKQLEQLLSAYSLDELLQHGLPSYFSSLNNTGYDADAIVGTMRNQNPNLLHANGIEDHLVPIISGGVVVARPGEPDYLDVYNPKEQVSNASQARELAIYVVRQEIMKRPEKVSGLEVIQLDNDGVQVVYYEPPHLPLLKRLEFHRTQK